jgi:hypothetical protein
MGKNRQKENNEFQHELDISHILKLAKKDSDYFNESLEQNEQRINELLRKSGGDAKKMKQLNDAKTRLDKIKLNLPQNKYKLVVTNDKKIKGIRDINGKIWAESEFNYLSTESLLRIMASYTPDDDILEKRYFIEGGKEKGMSGISLLKILSTFKEKFPHFYSGKENPKYSFNIFRQ